MLSGERFLGRDAKADASVERHGLNLNVETPSVRLLARAAEMRRSSAGVCHLGFMLRVWRRSRAANLS